MAEASEVAPSAAAIRALFVYILINCSPADPLLLWTNYRERMADDYFYALRRTLRGSEEELTPEQISQIYQRALGDLESRLQATGHHLSEFPSLPQDFVTELDLLPPLEALEIVERREYDAVEQHAAHEALLRTLNNGQQHAFDAISNAIDGFTAPYTPQLFFVNGPGGTGKSQLFKTLLSYVRSRNQIALPVASSGIAALLLEGGRTAHSRFKIPLNADENTTRNLRLNGPHAYLIRQASLFIWDEAVMCSKYNFEAVDRSLRDIMGAVDPMYNDVPFGGKVFVFGGDFRQLLPVVKRGNRSAILAECIQSANFWNAVQVLHLTENMRVRQAGPAATAFADTLLAIGDGRDPYTTSFNIPSEWRVPISDPMTLIHAIYPFIRSQDPQPEHFANRAILAAKNIDVDAINQAAFSVFPGDARTYTSNDRIIDADDPEAASINYPVEFLNSITTSGIPPHSLELKLGMPLVMTRNLDPDAGLCNGTKLFVTRLLEWSIGVKRMDQGHAGEEHIIPRIHLCTQENEYPFILCRRQFPVRPAFAMTIHKAQGQTLHNVGIRLQEPIFAHGQLYVALSRATDPNNVRIAVDLPEPTSIDTQPTPTTDNIVYPEILLPAPAS